MEKQAYIDENTDYIDDDSLAAIEQIPAEIWHAATHACKELCGSPDLGLACKVATTRETLEDFDNSRDNHWAERGQRREWILATTTTHAYKNIQIAKGQRRQSLAVIDFGDFRVCLTA